MVPLSISVHGLGGLVNVCKQVSNNNQTFGPFVYRNGPEWAELPEWTLIDAHEYFLCILLGQSGKELPQKAIILRNMQFMYPKIWPRRI